jgi:hypothetical protein
MDKSRKEYVEFVMMPLLCIREPTRVSTKLGASLASKPYAENLVSLHPLDAPRRLGSEKACVSSQRFPATLAWLCAWVVTAMSPLTGVDTKRIAFILGVQSLDSSEQNLKRGACKRSSATLCMRCECVIRQMTQILRALSEQSKKTGHQHHIRRGKSPSVVWLAISGIGDVA